jgi:hypothetical protein
MNVGQRKCDALTGRPVQADDAIANDVGCCNLDLGTGRQGQTDWPARICRR